MSAKAGACAHRVCRFEVTPWRRRRAQKQVRAEPLPAGADWWMTRSAPAAMMALHLSGAVFRRRYCTGWQLCSIKKRGSLMPSGF
jgi:hypothetical protein